MPNQLPNAARSSDDPKILHLCINVPGEEDRRARMSNQAQKLEITLTFVNGVDGRQARMDDFPGFDGTKRQRFQAKPITKAELACTASHERALKTFLADDADFAVVLEDNAQINPRYLATIANIARAVDGFDVIRLERRKAYKTKYRAFAGENYTLYAEPNVGNGATGMLYSRMGARKVLKSLERYWYAFDTHLGFFWRHKLNIFVVHGSLVERSQTRSLIDTYSPERTATPAHRASLPVYLAARGERLLHEVMKHIFAPLNARKLKPRAALHPSHPVAA